MLWYCDMASTGHRYTCSIKTTPLSLSLFSRKIGAHKHRRIFENDFYYRKTCSAAAPNKKVISVTEMAKELHNPEQAPNESQQKIRERKRFIYKPTQLAALISTSITWHSSASALPYTMWVSSNKSYTCGEYLTLVKISCKQQCGDKSSSAAPRHLLRLGSVLLGSRCRL